MGGYNEGNQEFSRGSLSAIIRLFDVRFFHSEQGTDLL
jgi:hypothetical protein